MPKKKKTTLGQQIRAARQDAGLTQAELATKAGLSRGQREISEIERGKYQHVWTQVQKIRRALEMT